MKTNLRFLPHLAIQRLEDRGIALRPPIDTRACQEVSNVFPMLLRVAS